MLANAGRQMRDNSAEAARVKDLETQLAATQAQAGGLASERDAARSAQGELRDAVARLEQEKAQLASAQPAAPAYPDLSGRVRELESQLAVASSRRPAPAAPSYPDLSGRVGELETALAAAQQQLAALQSEIDQA